MGRNSSRTCKLLYCMSRSDWYHPSTSYRHVGPPAMVFYDGDGCHHHKSPCNCSTLPIHSTCNQWDNSSQCKLCSDLPEGHKISHRVVSASSLFGFDASGQCRKRPSTWSIRSKLPTRNPQRMAMCYTTRSSSTSLRILCLHSQHTGPACGY